MTETPKQRSKRLMNDRTERLKASRARLEAEESEEDEPKPEVILSEEDSEKRESAKRGRRPHVETREDESGEDEAPEYTRPTERKYK